ncbi:ChaN family lipoprotein [Amphritea pacifica]|uniref:ChaN family lipoprotein n=1 Tax=Amphritea pacifica TaxID=2811233 RepID=A0ABS2W966_9GAMM|nr:ChaN family lipoprotein [Amphritea pacifica]MBN0988263.1 ChaN family lipoprotein [Amphritea pacifica]MBN1008705.1 ChaN family lipoprotein [Amphritea pacifica]
MQPKERILHRSFIFILISMMLLSSGCQLRSRMPQNQPPTGAAQPLEEPIDAHPLSGKILSMVSGGAISREALFAKLRHSRFVLVGEKHDNPEHHQRELQLLQALQQGPQTRLVLEMLDEQQGKAINGLNSASSETQIQEQLHWNDHSWPWQDYGPLIGAALSHNNQLRAGNLSKPFLMQIYRSGVPDQPRLTTVGGISQTIRSTIQQQVYESHCRTMPLEQMGPMTDIQISRDASMAYALSEQLDKQMQAILITGAFHARKDTGVPQHLQKLTSDPVITILLTEVDNTIKTVQEAVKNNAGMADYIWFTSRSEEKDYCASLRQQPHKKEP